MKAILAGIVAGLDTVGFSIALAALVFTGPLAGGLGLAASATLLASAIMAFALARGSGLRGNVGHAQDIGVAVLAPALATMAASGTLAPEASVATAFAIIIASSLATGLLMVLTGWLGLGRMVKYFPQTVIAGFLAGTGWLLVVGGIAVAADLSMAGLFDPSAWNAEKLVRLAPVLVFALTLWLLLPRIANPAAMVMLLLAGVAIFHLGLAISGATMADAQAFGWLPAVLATGGLGDIQSMPVLIDWPTVAAALPSVGIVAILCVLAALMNTSALEAVAGEEADHDRELRVTGAANIACAAIAGPPGYSGLASSLIAHRISPGSRVAGAVTGAIALVGIVAADMLVSSIPIFVTAGLIIYLGADLLRDWLVDTRHRYSAAEWTIVLLIVVAVAVAGFATAVVLGLAIAVALFVFNYARVPVVRRAQTLGNLRSTLDRDPMQEAVLREKGAAVEVYQLQGFVFFGTAERLRGLLKRRLSDPKLPKLERLILDFGQVSGVDSAALALVERIAAMTGGNGVHLVLSRLRPDLAEALDRAAPALRSAQHVERAETLDEAVEVAEAAILGTPLHSVAPAEIARRYAVPDEDAPRLAAYFSALPEERLERGALVVTEGEPADGLILLEQGRVSVRGKSRLGAGPVRLRAMAAGSIIGDIGFANGGKRTADIVAETDIVIRRMSGNGLAALERDDPGLALVVLHAVARALAEKVVTANRAAQDL